MFQCGAVTRQISGGSAVRHVPRVLVLLTRVPVLQCGAARGRGGQLAWWQQASTDTSEWETEEDDGGDGDGGDGDGDAGDGE